MGSLDLDTKLVGGEGRYVTAISPDWKIWGPNGGYMTSLRSARTAESLRTTIEQNDRVLLDAQVWTVADGAGLEHDFAPMPDVPVPSQLVSFAEIEGFETRSTFPFWDNLEGRPIGEVPPAQRKPGAPQLRCWYRFRPDARFDEPSLDAARGRVGRRAIAVPAATDGCLAASP